MVLIKKLIFTLKKTIADALEIASSGRNLKQFLGISLYRNALYLLTSYLALPGTGFIFWIIAARYYSTADVGVASALISATGLVLIFSGLGFSAGIVRFLPDSGEGATRMINTAFTVSGLTAIVVSGIFIAGLSVWSPKLMFIRESLPYIAIFIALAACNVLFGTADWPFIARRRSDFTLAKGLIFGVVRLPLLVVFAVMFGYSGIYISWGIALAAALVISVIFFLPRVQPGYRPVPVISTAIVKEIAPLSLASYLSGLLWYVPTSVFPIIVLNMLGSEATAFYYIAWSVGNVLASVPMASSASLFAEGSRNEGELASYFQRSLKMTFLILVPSVIIVIAIADKLLLLFGSDYSVTGATLLRILAPAALPMAVNYLYLSMMRVQKRLKALVVLSSFIMVASLVLSYILLRLTGINGIGWAWLSSQSAAAVGVIGILSKNASSGKKR